MLLNEYYVGYNRSADNEVTRTDTVIYKFGRIIEYNPNPVKYRVEKISFSTSGCFGTCPVYQIEILKNTKAFYNAQFYTVPSGDFIGTIGQKRLDTLLALLAYIESAKLKDNYSVPWTDDQTGRMEIIFEDRTSKNIEDYGMRGTLGLQRVYSLFQQYRSLSNWVQWNDSSLSRRIDSYLLSFRSSFNFGNDRYGDNNMFQYTMTKVVDSADKKQEIAEKFKTETKGGFLLLYPDSTFAFMVDYGAKLHNRLSLGRWHQMNDSSITINWDGELTLNTCRDRKLYCKYFYAYLSPEPMRIENWSFTFTENRSALEPISKEENK